VKEEVKADTETVAAGEPLADWEKEILSGDAAPATEAVEVRPEVEVPMVVETNAVTEG
jgi:hypothetical protein